MNIKDYKEEILQFIFLLVLFNSLVLSAKLNNIVYAGILLIFELIFHFVFKREKMINKDYSKINILLIIFGICYVAIFYLFGMIINSYLSVPIKFGIKSITNYIIPISLVIIISELIRMELISLKKIIRIKGKSINISKIIAFISLVLVDMTIYTKTYSLTNAEDVLMIIGFVFFASVSSNLFFNYTACRYGIDGIIGYRLITVLYIYIFPVIPDIYVFFKSFYRMIFPFFMYLIIESTYGKQEVSVSKSRKRNGLIAITVPLTLMLLIIMLISCKFTYGLLVIGSNSMKGTIDMGDTIIYQKYNEKDNIKKDDIIVFWKYNVKTIHRVVKVENVNNQIIYYTKGDNNKNQDIGYITSNEILGKVNKTIKYIGYPSLWFNKLFN